MHSKEVNQIWQHSRAVGGRPLSLMSDLSAIIAELTQIMSSARHVGSSAQPQDSGSTPLDCDSTTTDSRFVQLRCQVALAKAQLMMGQLSEIATWSQSLTAELREYSTQCIRMRDLSREAVLQFYNSAGVKLLGTLPAGEHSSGCTISTGSN
jgi:hypothetical protein